MLSQFMGYIVHLHLALSTPTDDIFSKSSNHLCTNNDCALLPENFAYRGRIKMAKAC